MKQKVNTHREIYLFCTKKVFIIHIYYSDREYNQKDMSACIWKYTNIYATNGNEQNGYIFIHAYKVTQNQRLRQDLKQKDTINTNINKIDNIYIYNMHTRQEQNENISHIRVKRYGFANNKMRQAIIRQQCNSGMK